MDVLQEGGCYVSWRFKLNLALKVKGLFDVATGVKVKEEGSSSSTTEWEKKDMEAQALIGLNVESSIARKIANISSSFQMLVKLELLYGKKSDVTVEGLQRKFFAFEYNSGKSAFENCLEINQLAEELSTNGDTIKESWIMTRMLGMLPTHLHHFRTAWDNVSGADRCISTLLERLRLEEDRQKNSKSETNNTLSENALYSKNVSHKNRMSVSRDVVCYKCNKPGHLKKHCRNQPTQKYVEHSKANYACHHCNEKGHFAKQCPKKRRAFITFNLSSVEQEELDSESWFQDSGATQHMTFQQCHMINYVELETPILVMIGDGKTLPGVGTGDINLEAYDGKEFSKIVLQNVLHVPELRTNLFSVTQILDKGYFLTSDANKSEFKTEDGKIVALARRKGNLFQMDFRWEEVQKPTQEPVSCNVALSLRLWHERLAHQNIKYVRQTLNNNKIKYIDDWDNYVCPGCMYGKLHCVSHPNNPVVAEQPLDIVHVDLCEMGTESLGGSKYFLLFKDDHSHFRTVFFLKTKNEAVQKLKNFISLVENQFDRKIKCLRSDNGTEIKNRETKEIFESLGINHMTSVAYTPQQNGRIEREMRTIVEAARALIHENGLTENLWAEAVNYAVFTINQTGSSSVKGKTPADLWFGRNVDLTKLRKFGSTCYILIPEHKRSKMNRKSVKGIMVGYDQNCSSYRVYVYSDNNVTSTVNVVFDEKSNNVNSNTTLNQTESDIRECEDSKVEHDRLETDHDNTVHESEVMDQGNLMDVDHSETEDTQESQITNLPSKRQRKVPDKYKDFILNVDDYAFLVENSELSVCDENKWKEAMSDEYNSLVTMQTWELVNLPDHVKPLSCKWVLKKKDDGRYKARLVIRGFEQKEGVDYFDTFSPVAQYTSIRLLLSHAASSNLNIMTFDVKTAFLHGDLEEDIYMYQPAGYDDCSGQVCKLKKSLYGLKQAPKNWNDKFSAFLRSIDFENTDDDPCVYYNRDRSIILTLFVDDGLIVGKDKAEMNKVMNLLRENFEITFKESNESFTYLGMQIQKIENCIILNQENYIEKMLKRFKLENVNPVNTPMEPGMLTDGQNLKNDKPLDPDNNYREMIGSLLYCSIISRPDISFAVNYLSRFNANPMISHMKCVKRIFQYLKGTKSSGIMYNGDTNLMVYSDSDFGGDSSSGCSTSGVLVVRGGPILWYAQKQRLVATSTAEAEYRAAVSAIDEISLIRRLGYELGIFTTEEPTKLLIDNQSAIHMLKNAKEGKVTKGKKHIEISRKFIQYHINKTVLLEHVNSSDQLADIFTKPVTKKIFQDIKNKIMYS